MDAHPPHRPFPTDSDRSGNVSQSHGANAAASDTPNYDLYNYVPHQSCTDDVSQPYGANAAASDTPNYDLYNYVPHQSRTDNADNLPRDHLQSTASGLEQNSAHQQNSAGLRLPRQPARASSMATSASSAASLKPKKGEFWIQILSPIRRDVATLVDSGQ